MHVRALRINKWASQLSGKRATHMFSHYGYNRESNMDVEKRGTKRRGSGGDVIFTKKSKALPKVTEAQIKRVVNKQSEMKYHDQVLVESAILAGISAGTSFTPAGGLFNPGQGVTISTRVGAAAYLHKLRLKCKFQIPAQAVVAGGSLPSIIRYALVRDMEPGTSLPTGAEVFTTAALAIESVNALQESANFGRFQVLKDETIILQNPNLATTGTHGIAECVRINHTFKPPLKVRFNSTPRPNTDQFYIFAWTNSISLNPTISYLSRACFKED